MDRDVYLKGRLERLERISYTAWETAHKAEDTDLWEWSGQTRLRVTRLKARMLQRYVRTRLPGESPILDGHVSWSPKKIETDCMESAVLRRDLKYIHDKVHPLVLNEVETWGHLPAVGDSESCEGHVYCGQDDMVEVARRIRIIDPKTKVRCRVEEDWDFVGHPTHLNVTPGYILARTRLAYLKVPGRLAESNH